MDNNPTTREVLDLLYKRIEERMEAYKKKMIDPASNSIIAETRFSECSFILAMIVGMENEYNI